MEASTKSIIVFGSVCAAIGFVLGVYTLPNKTITTSSSKDSEQTDSSKNVNKTQDKTEKVVIREETKPDGTVKKTTVITQQTQTTTDVQKDVHNTVVKEEESRKEVTRGSGLNLSVLYGMPLNFGGPITPVYGGHISKAILGPVSIGVWGLTSREFGASVGLSF